MKKSTLNLLTILIVILSLGLSFFHSSLRNKLGVFENEHFNEITLNYSDSSLILNNNEILTKFIIDAETGTLSPVSESVWNKQIKRLFGFGYFDNDSAVVEKNAQIYLRNINNIDSNGSLSSFQQVIRILTNGNQVIRIPKNPVYVSDASAEAQLLEKGLKYLPVILTIFLALLILLYNKTPKPVKRKIDFRSLTEEVPKYIEPETTIKIEKDPVLENLKDYSYKFIEKYGDLYEKIEALPSELSSKDREPVLKDLIEMAVHSYSYHRLGRQNGWKTLNENPNAQKIIGKEVLTSKLKNYSDDPSETDRKFRFFVKILKELGIKSIDVFLRDEVVVNPEDLN